MTENFRLPRDLLGRFAVVKLWPDIKAAEDECIARLKITATKLGLKCLEIHADGRLLDDPSTTINKNDVDFVLHLHYDTPKLYDAFSFVALWNPTSFYHEWGYSRCSRNIISHDDFLSCSSTPADDHLRRLIRNSRLHLPPFFNLYHSVVDIIHPPSLGDQKLFYAGINWEKLAGKKSRHQELLKHLDSTGMLRIYGPTLFQGVRVWKDYKSYVRELPFDGTSMIDEIAKAGIALVLSSTAHKQSELMSNRLFESIAAGALVICDENKFAKKFFNETLLYIDSRDTGEKISHDIFNHLNWIEKHPREALEMIAGAQDIFRQKFSLKQNLQELYEQLSARKSKLISLHYPTNKKIQISLNLFMPEYSDMILSAHIASVSSQEYKHFSPRLVIDKTAANENRQSLVDSLAKSPVPIDIFEIDFFTYSKDKTKYARRFGEIIAQTLETASDNDAVMFVAPNEKLFSNHLGILAGSLARNHDNGCAATSAILKHNFNIVHGTHERIDFHQLNPLFPIGYARFIFRISALPSDLNLALPYVDKKTMAVLIGNNKICQEIPATVIIQTECEFPCNYFEEAQENELLSSFCPSVFKVVNGWEIILSKIPTNQEMTNMPSAHSWTNQLILTMRWIIAQIRALRAQGIGLRILAAKTKFKRVFL